MASKQTPTKPAKRGRIAKMPTTEITFLDHANAHSRFILVATKETPK